MKLYRTLEFGRPATFQVLDTRQYRTDQPNDDRASELNDDALNPTNTILGAEQANWLKSATPALDRHVERARPASDDGHDRVQPARATRHGARWTGGRAMRPSE